LLQRGQDQLPRRQTPAHVAQVQPLALIFQLPFFGWRQGNKKCGRATGDVSGPLRFPGGRVGDWRALRGAHTAILRKKRFVLAGSETW